MEKDARESHRTPGPRKSLAARGPVLLAKAVPGCEEALETELLRLFATPWLPRKEIPTLTREEGGVRLEGLLSNDVHEPLFRTRTCEDFEWILHEARCHETAAFTSALERCGLAGFLPRAATVRVRVDSVSSHLFHERALATAASRVLTGVFGFEVIEAATNPNGGARSADYEISLRLKENRLRIAVSLTGRSAGRRGYKASLEGKAPLREEQAASCYETWRAAIPSATETPTTLWVPFAGTGTLGFEGALARVDAALVTPERVLAASRLPFWSEKTWAHLGKKQAEACVRAWGATSIGVGSNSTKGGNADAHAPAFEVCFVERDPRVCEALRANVDSFSRKAIEACGCAPAFRVHDGDFHAWQPAPGAWDGRHVVIPLNPPYGVRLHARGSSYEAIAKRLLALRSGPAAGAALVTGFLLCPDEGSWKLARDAFGKGKAVRTTHFMQGGMDVRVLVFSL